MEIYCKGVARIRHSATGVVYEIASKELDWDAVGGDERQMGAEIHYEAVLEHPELGTLTWGLWEYPIGVPNYNATDAGSHEVVEDFDYSLQHKPDPDEWIEYEVPADPFGIFLDSYHHTGDLLADHGKENGRDLFNRLVFSHQITALEAYLSDTLINAVTNDAGALQRMIEQDEDLSRAKFTLAQISKDPTLIERNVREHLRTILYHNLAKVSALYAIALGLPILDLAPRKGELFKAVMLRHDCVHRNGFDKDGKELTVFTRAFVADTADLVRGFVERIENAVRMRSRT